VTEPQSSEALKSFLDTLRAGEVRTGCVIGVEDGRCSSNWAGSPVLVKQWVVSLVAI
jgi:hypothetical protein